jgi:dTDP-4-dehydrorhamnose 3,5-epimerase
VISKSRTLPSGLLDGAARDPQSITADWQPVGRELVAGVAVIDIRSVPKRHGVLTEVFRADWVENGVVDQIFQVSLAPGGISAWHVHRETTDRLFVASGSITLVLFDARTESPSHRRLNELHMTIARPQLVVIPAGVWHGLIVTGTQPAIILNAPDRAYGYEDPDHWRLPPDTPEIPYRFGGGLEALT